MCVSPGGFEPPASALSGRRSDRLSYGDERGERGIRTLGRDEDVPAADQRSAAFNRTRPALLAPRTGIEPATSRSTGACSPTELTGRKCSWTPGPFSGPGRGRTGHLRFARAALSQMSYEPWSYAYPERDSNAHWRRPERRASAIGLPGRRAGGGTRTRCLPITKRLHDLSCCTGLALLSCVPSARFERAPSTSSTSCLCRLGHEGVGAGFRLPCPGSASVSSAVQFSRCNSGSVNRLAAPMKNGG